MLVLIIRLNLKEPFSVVLTDNVIRSFLELNVIAGMESVI